MRLKKIILNNFLTYENLEYEFERRPLLVQGLNLTDENQKSNGAGKSAIQTGIEYCITASNSRDVRDVELVAYGHPEARAQLIVSCDIRKETIHIDWTLKAKGSNKVRLTKQVGNGDWEEVSFSNVNDGKKWILNWFGISKEDLFNYFIINKSRFKSFFKSSNREKVDLINRFSDASIIDGLEEIDNSMLETDVSTMQADINKIEGKIEMVELNLQREKNRDFKEELNIQIDEYKTEIEDAQENLKELTIELKINKGELLLVENQIVKAIESYDIIKESLDEANAELEDFTMPDYSKDVEKLESEISEVEEDLDLQNEAKKDWEAKQSKIEALLSQINTKLAGEITCPSCSHKFVLDGDIEELKKNKDSALSMVPKVEAKIEECKSKMKSCEVKIESIEAKFYEIDQAEDKGNKEKRFILSTIDSILTKVRSSKSNIDNLEKEQRGIKMDIGETSIEITRAENLIKENEANIEGLKAGNNKSLITTLKKDLSALELTKASLNKDLIKLNDSIYLRNQWKNNFKQFRGHLANQSLEVMEYHSNRYLKDMGSDLIIKFEGFKTLANGTVKDEITARVIRNGSERTFDSFSGGEKGRLLFASILANRHMINKTHQNGGLDFLSIDEIFEGVDGVGLHHLIKSAKQLDITAMIITHVTDENASADVLTVIKENGKSRIE